MNIKQHRIKWNLTQQQLAERLGVSESVISRWENESRFPRFPMLVKLSEFFGLTIGQLIDNSEYLE